MVFEGNQRLAIKRTATKQTIEGSRRIQMADAASGKWMIEVAGTTAAFACPAGQTLLKAMIAAGRSVIQVGCRSGGCGVCRVRVAGGRYASQKMTRSRISEADEAAGIVLACRIVPETDLVVEPLPIAQRGAAA